MIQLLNLSLAFGGQQVLDAVTWTVKPGQRIGLIGPNGAGKTTLLRVIAGRFAPDAGSVSLSGGATLGYLEQDVQEMQGGLTVLEDAMRAFASVLELQRQEDEITHALDTADDHESESYLKLLHALDRVHTELLSLEAHRMQDRTEAVLEGLGFATEDLHRPMHTFSGGWRMRVALARLLLQRPDFLLLDEPTNHLDIDSIDWLEDYLKSYAGTVVIVSHDRYFLDRMVTTIAELARGKVTEYPGNYAYYLVAREERRALQQSAFDNQQKSIADTERFIERFRSKATKARQVQSRIKQLDKVERVAAPLDEQAGIHFRFPEPERSGRVVLEFSVFSKVYAGAEGRVEVFRKAGPLTIERGDKVALIGRNGAGKSTLARMIIGAEPFEGERTLGYNVGMTYFAQHQAEALDPEATILDALRTAARGHTDTEIRSLLGAFLFSGDDVFKRISVLSGGEKSRVALARTLLAPANFLVLDEPTNHLDIRSVNVLVEAMRQFTGTLVVVSHDRHFLDQVSNQVWRVGDGGVRAFKGNYSDYLWQTQPRAAAPAAAVEAAPTAPRKAKEDRRREADARNRPGGGPSAARLRKSYEQLEAAILAREADVAAIEAELALPDLYADVARFKGAMARYEAAKAELTGMYREWETLAEQLTA